jgi:hypothetical protein
MGDISWNFGNRDMTGVYEWKVLGVVYLAILRIGSLRADRRYVCMKYSDESRI